MSIHLPPNKFGSRLLDRERVKKIKRLIEDEKPKALAKYLSRFIFIKSNFCFVLFFRYESAQIFC